MGQEFEEQTKALDNRKVMVGVFLVSAVILVFFFFPLE